MGTDQFTDCFNCGSTLVLICDGPRTVAGVEEAWPRTTTTFYEWDNAVNIEG